MQDPNSVDSNPATQLAKSVWHHVEPGVFEPLISNDAVIFGILMLILGVIFYTSSSKNPSLKTFYKFVPMLLLCYFVPSLLTFFEIVDPHHSNLGFVAKRYFLPASLILLTLSIDLGGIIRLGPKAIIMFLTGTAGVMIGAPLAFLIVGYFNPDLVGGETWRGYATVAGSWIGGGANQLAMKELFTPSQSMFSAMVAVDVLVAEFWMLFLLLGVGKADAIDRWFNADNSSIVELQEKMEQFSKKSARIPTTTDLVVLIAIIFGGVGLCHFLADWLAPTLEQIAKNDMETYGFIIQMSLHSSFFWLIVLSTTLGLLLSFTKARSYEGIGASRIGTLFIFILVATIGMTMDIRAVVQYPGYFLVGLIWMVIHVGLLVFVGYMIRAPYFYLAVGSKANIGGAASAPVVAGAFHPSLAPVGVLLATLGYALGTYGAYICAGWMYYVAPK